MTNRRFQTHFSGSLAERLKRRINNTRQRSRDRGRATYLPEQPATPGRRYFPLPGADALHDWEATLAALGENYLRHHFDILGSGWKQIYYGMPCAGLEEHRYDPEIIDPSAAHLRQRLNAANAAPAGEIRRLIDVDFTPIDWHLDIKSGYRWGENIWHRDIRYRGIPGADAKVPWELARMHHLAQLALAYGLADRQRPGFRAKQEYADEFRNQVLDFIAANPPRYGINWCCTMDVAIRAANLLVAHDLFGAAGHDFEADFETLFWRSIREHGRHITANFERHGARRNNHYLANILGLLFAGAYLPADAEADSWLEFAAREFFAEAQYQFSGDGGNFEASTSYHRLGAEMMLYGAALLLAIPDGPELPDWFCARLEKMAEFSVDIASPSGRAVQIGDTDSGRFLKLFPLFNKIPLGDAKSLQENHLDHRHLVAGISALIDNPRLMDFSGAGHPERQIIAGLARGKKLSGAPGTANRTIGSETELAKFLQAWERTPSQNRQSMRFPLPETPAPGDIKTACYADFGLYILRAPELFMTIRCGGENSRHPRGHAHNDQLSVELWIGGACLIADPGSYIYTPLPRQRNAYRSVKAHFAPQIEGVEPSSLARGLFALGPPTGAECLYFGGGGFVGRHRGYGAWIWRAVRIADTALEILDRAEAPGHILVANQKILGGRPAYSPGYGILRPDGEQN